MLSGRGLRDMARYADVVAPITRAEMRRYLKTGIDGLFSDDPALARMAIGAGLARSYAIMAA